MKKALILCLLQLLPIPSPCIADDVTTRIEQPVEQANSILQKTQANEENWRLTKEKLIATHTALRNEVEELTRTRDELKTEIDDARQRISTKKQELADIMTIEQEMDPFLNQLDLRIKTLPETGLPFLIKERKTRISHLDTILHDPDISISEKYRKVLETLQIEAEFGVTIETYQDMIKQNGQQLLVNILRLGRLGLYYVNLDESGCGFYNIADKGWQQLDKKYIHSLQTAVAIASKRQPAEFINIPLGRLVKK